MVAIYALGGLLMLALMLYVPAALLRFVLYDRVSAAFEVREVVGIIQRNLGNYLLALVLYFVANFASQIGMVLCCVGVFPLGFWSFCILAWGLGEVARRDPVLTGSAPSPRTDGRTAARSCSKLASGSHAMSAHQDPRALVPARYQPPLPLDRLILEEPPGSEHVAMDVVFVGGGPAGLAGAIELARLVRRDKEQGGGLGDVEIAVLEKAENLGEHCLSGRGREPGGASASSSPS